MSYNRSEQALKDLEQARLDLRVAEDKARFGDELNFRANMVVVAACAERVQDARLRLKKAELAIQASREWLNSYYGQQIKLRRESYVGDDGLPF